MKSSGTLLIAVSAAITAVILALAGSAGPLAAQTAQSTEPIEVAKFPYIEIFSPTFFWNDEADFIRTGSTTCPKGRAITGGMNIQQGKASLRILESYPDGESWVMRVVNRQKPDTVQSLQVRGFALCLLPAARKASVLLTQQSKLLHVSGRFGLPSGLASATGRQACPQGSLVISGGFGLDPAAGLHNLEDFLCVTDIHHRVGVDENQIGQLPLAQGSDLISPPHNIRGCPCRPDKDIKRTHARFDHQFHFPVNCRTMKGPDVPRVCTDGDPHVCGCE